MPCPSCGYVVADPRASRCPNCGRLLEPPATTASAGADARGAGSPFSGQGFSPPPDAGQYPAYGAQPSYPAYPAYPGQPTPPSVPLGQGYYAPPSAPLPQGSYAPPSAPLGYPPQYPTQGYPQYYAPPPPPPPARRRTGPVIAIVASIVLVVALLGAGGAVLLSHKGNHSGTPGAQTSYSGTKAAGPTATLAATPDVNVLFQDNFSSNTSGWPNDSHCSYGSDGYHIPDGYICYAPTGQIGDAVVSADLQQTAGEVTWFYGIVFRRVSEGNFYEMLIDSNGKWLFDKVVNNQTTTLLPYVPSSAIHTGLNTSNTLAARAVGSHFEFFVNGTQVGQFDDSTFTTGLTGVEGGDPKGQVQVLVTKFTLSRPN